MAQGNHDIFDNLSESWRKEATLVRLLRDKLGLPVDRKVRDTIVALRLLGFTTSASCGGHGDRVTTGPYVMLHCKPASLIVAAAKIEPAEKVRDTLLFEARMLTLREATKLRRLVESFSHHQNRQGTSVLEIRPVGYSGFRLCFVHADFSYVLSQAQHKPAIKARQAEMDSFCTYLETRLKRRHA